MLVFLFVVLFAIGLLCALVLLIWSIVVVRKYWTSPPLWQSLEVTVPSAVLSALVFGLIVGLSIYYLQHSEDAQERARAEQQQAHLARERIISLIRRELSYDLEAIRARRQAGGLNTAFAQIYQKPLKRSISGIRSLALGTSSFSTILISCTRLPTHTLASTLPWDGRKSWQMSFPPPAGL